MKGYSERAGGDNNVKQTGPRLSMESITKCRKDSQLHASRELNNKGQRTIQLDEFMQVLSSMVTGDGGTWTFCEEARRRKVSYCEDESLLRATC
jgi:hypothetical protein